VPGNRHSKRWGIIGVYHLIRSPSHYQPVFATSGACAGNHAPEWARNHRGMMVNTITVPPSSELTLAAFLRARRERLAPDPSDGSRRRRTPGLRREEVAARAGVSVAWYTWLEQGRGGPPSDEVLERLSEALELDASAREAIFLLAQRRPPPPKLASASLVTPALQRLLDSMRVSPAYLKTPAWDIVAQNAAAAAVLTDYAKMPSSERNALRRLFSSPEKRALLVEWEADARYAVAAFRIDAARGGDYSEAAALASELLATSADFRRFWAENEMQGLGSGVKHIQHPLAGPLTLEHSTFSVEGGNGLTMIVFTPASPVDAQAIATLLSGRPPTA
jgi:transcriptional regulator with XRE-family HTH domain